MKTVAVRYSSPYPLVRGTSLSAGYDLRPVGVVKSTVIGGVVEDVSESSTLGFTSTELAARNHKLERLLLDSGVRVAFIDIPVPMVGLVTLRSGFGWNNPIRQTNSIGTIDQDYLGRICIPVEVTDPGTQGSHLVTNLMSNSVSSAIAQLLLIPTMSFGYQGGFDPFTIEMVRVPEEEIKSLETQRGEKGFGSTDVLTKVDKPVDHSTPQPAFPPFPLELGALRHFEQGAWRWANPSSHQYELESALATERWDGEQWLPLPRKGAE